MSKSQMIKIERKNESKKIEYLVYSAIFAAAILAMVTTALLITNSEKIKTQAGIEIVNEMIGNILELNDSVNLERDIVSSILFQTKLINQSILELNSSLLFLRNEIEQFIEEKIPELSSMRELSSNMVELNQSVNELATMTQQQIREISSNVDGLSTQVESNFASSNKLTVGVQILNQITQSINYTPEGIAPSCSAIVLENPFAPSGYYWVQSCNGSAIRVYCDMTRTCGNITGGWMRVAELDMTRNLSQCPPGLCLSTTYNRICRICSYEGGCSLDVYPVGVSYSRVCGRVIGYQVGNPDAFSLLWSSGVDGVQITYGNPPMNIWTFAVAVDEIYNNEISSVCPCINPSDSTIQPVPSSFGNNYFCDTAGVFLPDVVDTFISNNTLWDGAGCGNQNTCCSFNNPPWFYRKLPGKTIEDIEMRVCRDENRNNEDIAIEIVDIFVQ